MYVYQDGKLYVQSGEKLVWVEIYPDLTFTITEEEVERKVSARNLSNGEVKAKFHLTNLVPVERKQAETKEPELEMPTMKNTVAQIKEYAEHVGCELSEDATKKTMLAELEAFKQ